MLPNVCWWRPVCKCQVGRGDDPDEDGESDAEGARGEQPTDPPPLGSCLGPPDGAAKEEGVPAKKKRNLILWFGNWPDKLQKLSQMTL